MRVLLISPYPPTRDGIGTYSASLVEALAEAGHEVAVLSARADAPAPAEVIGVVPRAGGAAREAALDAIAHFAPDIIHVQFAVAAYAGSVFGVLGLMRALTGRGYRIVTTLHEVTRDTASLRGPGRALYRAVARHSAWTILHTVGAARCLGELLGGGGPPREVIPHPRASLPPAEVLPAELAERHGLTGRRVVLSFGFIDVDKGIEDLLSAVATLVDDPRYADVSLAVAGTVRRRFGPFRIFELRDRIVFLRLQRQVRDLGLGDRVVFAGYVPGGEMRGWFELARVAALAYRRCEASGVANIAAAVGTPVIATAVGELVALSVVPGLAPADPAGFAAGLAQALDGDASATGAPAGPEGLSFAEIAERTVASYTAALSAAASAR